MNKHKRRLRKYLWIIPAVMAGYILFALLFGTKTVITVNEPSLTHVEYGSVWVDPGASARTVNVFLPFLEKDIDVRTEGTVNTDEENTYDITYTAGNGRHKTEAVRKVTVKDTRGPLITLTYNPDYYTLYNHPYEEEGYHAEDLKDGDCTASVRTETKGDWIYYTASDTSGNTSTYIRAIPYDDRTGPVLCFSNGDAEEETIYVGSAWDTAVTAQDDSDGDVTAQITSEGSVDTSIIGDYPVKYTVSDSHGNTTELTHTVHVRPLPVNKPAGEDSRTIYLTFDDGPGPYTQQLLDILDKYNVKATFFTTSSRPVYTYLIGEEYRRGHTVAVHTYSHNYAAIYSSTDAYWSDFSQQNAVIQAQTGQTTTIFRFPGGSSNTVSKNYCPGIMTALTQQASAKGYTYFDWNISSGDAGGTTDTDTVYKNVISGIQQCSAAGVPSVVLQHDIKDFSVNAVEKIITWALENGYHFSALTAGSHQVHHHINN
jgi:peptidoglycan/xylan/chitin deacetylase (PgdA/CDA1 family)